MLAHRRSLPLVPGEIVPLEIEIRHVIYSGGDYDSHLLVPVLGPTSAA